MFENRFSLEAKYQRSQTVFPVKSRTIMGALIESQRIIHANAATDKRFEKGAITLLDGKKTVWSIDEKGAEVFNIECNINQAKVV